MDKLSLIIHTLNHIEVSGKGNLTRLLGCIQELEKMKEEMLHEDHDEPRKDA